MSLRAKLFLIIAAAMFGIALLAIYGQQRFTHNDFGAYQRANMASAAEQLASSIAEDYQRSDSWEQFIRMAGDRPALYPSPRHWRRGGRGPKRGYPYADSAKGRPGPRAGPEGYRQRLPPGQWADDGGRRPPPPPHMRRHSRFAPADERPPQRHPPSAGRVGAGPDSPPASDYPDSDKADGRPAASDIGSVAQKPSPAFKNSSAKKGPYGLGKMLSKDAPARSYFHRFGFADAQRNWLSLQPDTEAELVWQPVEDDGNVIAWLAYDPSVDSEHPLDARFEARQRTLMWVLLAASLLISGLVAWALSGLLLGRIRQLLDATRKVASGDLSGEMQVRSEDELGQLQLAFNQMNRALQASADREHRWLADISHELRTPLTLLRGEIEAIQDGIRRGDPEALGSLREEVLHLVSIVDDLYLLSTSEGGHLRMQLEAMDFSDLVQRTLDHHRNVLERDGFDLDCLLAESLIVRADSHRLRQVLLNLLQNLTRHANPGSVKVRLIQQGDFAVFTLADSGPGVAVALREKLFDRLFRVEQHRGGAREGSGSGLGLAICKSLIEAHRGKIRALENSHGGLTMEIVLPLVGREQAATTGA